MSALPKKFYSPEEYLALERVAECKSDLCDGEIIPRAVCNSSHNLIVSNIIGAMRAQIKKLPCTAFTSDMRFKVAKTDSYFYADFVVVCGKLQLEDEDNLLNPTLLVEVFSQNTAGYDRGEKFRHYRQIPSFREFLLIAQDRCYIEHYVKRKDGRWEFSVIDELQSVIGLPSIECELAVAEIYDKVEFKRGAEFERV